MAEIIASTSAGKASPGYSIIDLPFPGAYAPTVVNSWTTLGVPAYFRACNFKASNMASFPRSVRQNNAPVSHRLDKLLSRKSNNYQPLTMTWRTLFFHKAHYANAFLEIQRDGQFNAIALHNRPPELVSIFRLLEDDGNISGWFHVGGKVNPHIVPQQDMIHLTGISYDGMVGLNPILLHDETFERARLLDRYITKFLVKGSVIRGSIEVPTGVTEDQLQKMIDVLKKFKGADADDDLLLLSDGAKLNNGTMSNEQSQIIELQKLSTKQIGQLTDVNPHFLFDDSEGKYNTLPVQAGEDVVRYLFRLEIEQAEDELLKLLTDTELDQGFKIHIDPNALIRGDAVGESNIVISQMNAGAISRNESREALGYPKTDDPKDDQLHTLGDTTPQDGRAAPPVPDATKQSRSTIGMEMFQSLLSEAASRVETKTVKASENANKKFASDAEGLTRWINIFAEEQAKYTSEALTPIFTTISKVTGRPIDTETAAKIGQSYASRLRGSVARNEALPDLRQIIQTILQTQGEANAA